MYESPQSFKGRIEQRIEELYSLTIKRRTIIEGWKFCASDNLYPPVDGWEHVSVGHLWNNTGETPVWFEASINIPKIEANQDLVFSGWFGGESLCFIDTKPVGELNPYHKRLNLNDFADSKTHILSIQVVPHLLFGEKSKNRLFEHAHLLCIDKLVKAFADKLKMSLETAYHTRDKYLQESLFLLIEKVLKKCLIPRVTQSYCDSLMDNDSINKFIQKKYISEALSYSQGSELTFQESEMILRACEMLDEGLRKLKDTFPQQGKISAVGHAHIDYAWLWPISETRRKIPRTFSNALSMLNRYDDFIFSQSSAQMYKDLKQDYPELMKKIKEYVKSGRWEVLGGSWVENDCNIPSPESLIRQFYYGQRYFKSEFDTYCKTAWLPDVFGFPWIMPQIIKQAGMDSFFTIKLTWNEKNEIPHDIMLWRGIDGSEVVYRSFKSDKGYNALIDPQTIFENWDNYREKAKIPLSLISYGYGDGGGGPCDDMMDYYEQLKHMPGIPQLQTSTAKTHFAQSSAWRSEMEIWDDELYLEFHRGTYTTQAKTKALHKAAEETLILSELLCTLLKKPEAYPHKALDTYWEILLRNEFHDILPGSSIPEVYVEAEKELEGIVIANTKLQASLIEQTSNSTGDYLSLFNPCEYERQIEFFNQGKDAWLLKDADGKTLIPYKTFDGKYLYQAPAKIEPFSEMAFFKEKICSPQLQIADRGLGFENRFYKTEITREGSIQIYDKSTGRNLFKTAGNVLKLYEDVPMFWDAWDTAYNYEDYEIKISAQSVDVIESNELRKVIEVVYSLEQTKIVQRYIFSTLSKTILIENDLDWHHRRLMLKADFDTSVLSRKAAFDLGAGYIFRNTHKNTDKEKARFEVPGHRWVDISERDFGVGIINDGKYGYSTQQSKLSLTLLRSPINPSVYADEGRHTFTYGIMSHRGSDLFETIKEARNLNRPILVHNGKNRILTQKSLSISSENLQLLCFKRNINSERVLRLSENTGSRGEVVVSVHGQGIRTVYKSNILEEKLEEIKVFEGSSFKFQYDPFKIYTFVMS